jgi:hypothetical protein
MMHSTYSTPLAFRWLLVNATDCLSAAAGEEETVVAHGHGLIVTRQGGGGGESIWFRLA